MNQRASTRNVPRYGTIEKTVGETPLVALERFRIEQGIPCDTPLAYAGRLDPMASGKLLILIGDECKIQEKYHSSDKEYRVEILLGVQSDSGDVLGLLSFCDEQVVSEMDVRKVLATTVGPISLPYPHFSSKTVQGKPLHTWTLENRLNEITVPIKKSVIYKIVFEKLTSISWEDVYTTATAKIETIPLVTAASKKLGADFRRALVRQSWNVFHNAQPTQFSILTIRVTASSGTYMRSLSEHIGTLLGTCGLAYAIHRTKIGTYMPITRSIGIWTRSF